MDPTKTTRCTVCSTEFSDDEMLGSTCCPSCGTKSIPCAIKNDVTVKINWHELRILGIWADNWAHSNCTLENQKTLNSILKRLEAQFPDRSPLTLFGEVKELQNSGFDAELLSSNGDVIVPKRIKN